MGGLPNQEMMDMTIGMAHSLSRYNLKLSPDKIDTMIVQVSVQTSAWFIVTCISNLFFLGCSCWIIWTKFNQLSCAAVRGVQLGLPKWA